MRRPASQRTSSRTWHDARTLKPPALLFELRDDAELREALTAKAPVREPLNRLAEQILTSAGVSDAATHAPDLVGLVDALLMYQAAEAAPVDTRAVLTAYLEGLD